MTDFDNVTINDTLTMKAPNQQDYINIKTVWVTVPTAAPILKISQGMWGMKDFSCLGFLGSVSKTVIKFGATYTNCVPTDVGKMVKANGEDTSVLAAYDNVPDEYGKKTWWLAGSASVSSGSSMTIVDGQGAGTSSGDSSTGGGGAILMGHGLGGASDPPKIVLMDSAQGYDMLYLKKSDGTPAHLDLGNLTAHGNFVVGGYASISSAGDAIFNSVKGTSYAGAVKAGNEGTIAWDESWLYVTSHNKHMKLVTPADKVLEFNSGGNIAFNISGTYITVYGSKVFCPSNNNLGNIGGNGVAAPYWGSGWFNYLRYKNISSFDALDDLALVKQYTTKSIVEDDVEREVVDLETLPFVKADGADFVDSGKLGGFLLGCVKKLVLRVEQLEAELKK